MGTDRPQRPPLAVDLIDQGAFKVALDRVLREAGDRLLAYMAQYGVAGLKEKLVITPKLEVFFEDVQGKSIKVQYKFAVSYPSTPTQVSTACLDTDRETGQLFIASPPSGTSMYPPQQELLCTRAGEGIDPETGKASEALTVKFGSSTRIA